MTSAEQIRDYKGPALFSYGFRPFFLVGSIIASLLPLLMAYSLAGSLPIELPYGAITYHGHEMIFGFTAAIISGFILTAIPNWTGQLPILGPRLIFLFCLWLAGRIAFLFSDHISAEIAALIDCTYLFLLSAIIAREIITGKNWRNLPIALILTCLGLANLSWHGFVLLNQDPTSALYAALTLIMLLIAIIGGRIVPSFTNNWFAKNGLERLSIPFNNYDKLSILVLVLAMFTWLLSDDDLIKGSLLLIAAALHFIRLLRWHGWKTLKEPLVTILHIGYLWLPMGLGLLGLSFLSPDHVDKSSALHALTTGAIGTMTLAVMTRATLGHTGQELKATKVIIFIYGAVSLAALLRVFDTFSPFEYPITILMSAMAWFVAFILYACYFYRDLGKR